MKRTMLLTVSGLLVLLAAFITPAFAGDYVVQPGDTFSKIFGSSWREACEANKKAGSIKKRIRKGVDTNALCTYIYPGNKLIDPRVIEVSKGDVEEKKTKLIPNLIQRPIMPVAAEKAPKRDLMADVKWFIWEHIGYNPNKCSPEKSLRLLGLPQDAIDKLLPKIRAGQGIPSEVKKNDVFEKMLFGNCRVEENVLVNFEQAEAKRYSVVSGGKVYTIDVPSCNNYAIKSKPSVIEETVTETVPGFGPCDDGGELTLGAWKWWNKLAGGKGAYGEGLCWKKIDEQHSVAPVGFYGMTSPGKSKTSAYKWNETRLGLQVGAKRTWFADDKETGMPLLRQWIFKLRLALERMSGKNSLSGYKMEQRNTLLGVYGEYVHQLDDETLVGLTAEAWWAVHQSITSTWSGDKPASRTQLELLGFVQKQLSENWAFRLRFGPTYTGWDEQTWLKVIGEFRYDEWLMFGPWVSIPIGGLADAYKGLSVGDLTTFGAFVRVEFGKFMREHVQETRRSQITEVDASGNEIVTVTETPVKTKIQSGSSNGGSAFGWVGDVQASGSSGTSTPSGFSGGSTTASTSTPSSTGNAGLDAYSALTGF